MGIIEGNYRYFDIDSIKENLLNVFSEYYGEEYRSFIESKFNACDIKLFHSFDFVRKEYDKFIKKYEDEILNIFYKRTNIHKTDRINQWFEFNQNQYTHNMLSDLFNIYVYGRYYPKDINDEELLKEFKEDFNCSNLDDNEIIEKIIKLKKDFEDSIQEFFKNNPCDVFDDYNRENKNIVHNSQELLKFCFEQNLIKFTAKDLFEIYGKRLTEIDLATMDCYGRVFFENLTVPGLIGSFDSNSEQVLQDDNEYHATYIYLSRIRYLYLSGAKLKYIKEEDLFKSELEEREDYIELINKEYGYQCKNNSQYLVDTETADRIENMRKGLINKRYQNLKCYPQGEFFDYETDKMTRFNYFHVNKELNNNLYENDSRIYMNADDNEKDKNNKWFLIALIHELNHNLGSLKISKVGKNKYFRHNGLTSTKLFANRNNQVFGRFEAEQNTMSEEYVNQKQAEEMYEIYIKHYEVPNFLNIESDINEYASTYNDFEPILGDFYRAYREELKKSKVHDGNLFDNLDYPENKKEIISNFITIADDLYQSGENSEYYDMFDEDIRQELIDNIKLLRAFLTYGINNDLFDPHALLNSRNTDIRVKDRIRYQLILSKIFSTMEKVGIKRDIFRNNFKYNLKNKLGTLLKTEMNGAIDYSKMWELNFLLEQYREMLNKYGIRGVFDIKDRDELMIVMKEFLNEEDYEYFCRLIERKDYITRLMIRDKARYDKYNQLDYYDAEFIN